MKPTATHQPDSTTGQERDLTLEDVAPALCNRRDAIQAAPVIEALRLYHDLLIDCDFGKKPLTAAVLEQLRVAVAAMLDTHRRPAAPIPRAAAKVLATPVRRMNHKDALTKLAAAATYLEQLPALPKNASGQPDSQRGVSMLDAALILNDEDDRLALQQVDRWQKKRGPKPPSIGSAPEHAQRKLYALPALVNWIEKFEPTKVLSKHRLLERLIRKARRPRYCPAHSQCG